MRRVVMALCLWGLGGCAGHRLPMERLDFGMTRAEAEAALRAPLSHIPGTPREVYVAEQPARIPGAFPSTERVFLQFRRGRLTGWKGDWDVEWSLPRY